jgi:hypothetical protein
MPRCTITLPPQATSSRSKYGKFLEAWHLINGASRNLDGERSGRPLPALPEAGSGMRKTIYVEDLGMNEHKKRKEEEVEVLGLESRGRWQGKGAGLINFQSRLRPKSPVSEEIERIIQGRLNRG